jgi:hypothetical protein
MATLSTTLSSVGTSPAIILDPVKRTTSVQLTVTSGSCGTFGVQYTLDDPSSFGATGATGAAGTATWAALSTSIAIVSSTTLEPVGGLTWTVLSPLGGLRLFSSALGGGVTYTLKALQSVLG